MNTNRLMLHTGANTVTRENVEAVITPKATDTWYPIAHAALLTQVAGALEASGLEIGDEAHALGGDGNRYFGLLGVRPGNDGGALMGDVKGAADFGLVVGVRNSHDKSFPAGLVLGANVFVCDNLSFYGEVKLSRKHTVNIMRDLPGLVQRAVGILGGLRRTQEERFGAYKQFELTDTQAHDTVINALDAGILPVTLIPKALQEWRAPRHEEFRQGGKTAWRMFNGITEVLKGSLAALPARTQKLHGLLDSVVGLAAAPTNFRTEDAEIQVAHAG